MIDEELCEGKFELFHNQPALKALKFVFIGEPLCNKILFLLYFVYKITIFLDEMSMFT